MSLSVNHDVAVMPILNLQNVACNRICGHGLNEIEASFLEWDCILTTILGDEETQQIIDFSPTHLIPRSSIRNYINNTTLDCLSVYHAQCGKGGNLHLAPSQLLDKGINRG